MKRQLLRSLTVLVVINIGIGIPNSLQAQLPIGLETRYKVERVVIPEPIFEEVSIVRELRTNFSDPDNPYAIVVGNFTRSENDRYGHGFIYDHFGTINASAPKRFYALDQLPGTTYPPAWAGPNFTESKCFGLNSSGIVTGYLADPVTSEHLAFYLDINDPNLEIKEIPRPPDGLPEEHWFAGREVNEIGEILVRYIDLNNESRQFVFDPISNTSVPIPVYGNAFNSFGDLFLKTSVDPDVFERYNYITGVSETIPNDSLWFVAASNDVGQFAVVRRETGGRGRNRYDNKYVTRYGNDLSEEFDTLAREVYSLNFSGDFTFDRSSTGSDPLPDEVFVFEDEWGELKVTDLVPSGNPGDPADVFLNCQFVEDPRLSDRDSTGFGWIACAGTAAGAEFAQELFLLIPYVPGQTPGFSVSPTSGLSTSEDGGTDTFTVVLDAPPAADVTIGISSDNTNEGTVDKSSLTFTPGNWDTPQTVTVTGVDDAIEDGDVVYTIITAAATSTDPDYDGLDADDVSVTNEDDDGPPGSGSETYSSDAANSGLDIPDNDPAGIDPPSTIDVGDHLITNLTVNVDITHQRSSDLEVYLVGPDGGPPVQLFNFSGDNVVAEFNGENSLGDWTLEVYDLKKKKTGTLNSWSITVDY